MGGEKKFIIGIGVLTVIIVVAGAMLLGKQKPPEAQNTDKIDEALLLKDPKNGIGDPNAPVQIVEFGDYQCPACEAAYPIMKDLVSKNQNKVYFVFRNFPLSVHPNSQITSKAAEAAALQGKFWEMHDILYEKQKEWATSQNPKDLIDGYAKSIGLDIDKFNGDLDKVTGQVNSDYDLGNKYGVNSTPTFFINGIKYPGVQQEGQLQQLIDQLSQDKTGSPQSASPSAK